MQAGKFQHDYLDFINNSIYVFYSNESGALSEERMSGLRAIVQAHVSFLRN